MNISTPMLVRPSRLFMSVKSKSIHPFTQSWDSDDLIDEQLTCVFSFNINSCIQTNNNETSLTSAYLEPKCNHYFDYNTN